MSFRIRWHCAIVLLLCSCRIPEDDARLKAQATWRYHEAVVTSAAKGENVDLDEFETASEFFQRVAGIPIPGDGSYIGWHPTTETVKIVEPLRRWYEVYGDDLYWDGEKVVLLPQEKMKRDR